MTVSKSLYRGILLSCTAAGALFGAQSAFAQDDNGGVADIVVTAQKREQSMQDVPIAITALSQGTLEANRITNVQDLASTTPNLEVRTVAGGVGIPVFAMRGVVSYGSVPGQDKSISLYLDGVYIGSSQGSAFELPDLERIEVLRGPQGTLFGRNSTGGAVSIITRDPSGKFSARQVFTVGNYDQFRSSTRVEFPAWGPFSASVSYTHDERKGDMKNLGAGQVWDRTGAPHQGIQTSPKTLGDKNSESVFFALKFEPDDRFSTVYKFDWMENEFTPEGTALTAFTPGVLNRFAPGFGDLIQALYNANPSPIAGADRPKAVNNSFTTPGFQRVQGHSLTSNLKLSDNLSLKNIFAYRKSFIVASSDLTGAGSLVVTPALAPFLGAAAGTPYVLSGSTSFSAASQYSDELQLNYNSDLLTFTAGGLWFHIKSRTGAPDGFVGASIILSPIPGGVLPTGSRNLSFNTAESVAGYAQAEVHVTPQIDIVGGYRLTHDQKNGVAFVRNTAFGFTYNDTRPSYMGGVNYRPDRDILLYAKYSTGFVSGGSVASLAFQPETAKAWEGGVKADLFGRKLRTNLALFAASYKDLQQVQGGQFIGRPDLSTVVIRQADLKTRGFELEATLAPIRGLSINGSVGYTHYKASNINPFVCGADPCDTNTLRPKWTANVGAQYESEPLFGDTTLMARIDGAWRSKVKTLGQLVLTSDYDSIRYSKAGWNLNSRIALQNIDLAGSKVDIALWGRNLTNIGRPMFPIYFSFAGSTTYERARTYGVDLVFKM